MVLDQIITTAALTSQLGIPKTNALKAFDVAYDGSERELWNGREREVTR